MPALVAAETSVISAAKEIILKYLISHLLKSVLAGEGSFNAAEF